MVPTAMTIHGICALASSEAIVPFRYVDSVGVDTFGIGHTKNAGSPDPSSFKYGKEQSIDDVFKVFVKDLKKFERRVTKILGNAPTTPEQYDAIVHFDFNTGGAHKATWVKHHIAGNQVAAVQAILNWNKPKEILGRRQKEQSIYKGQYGNTMATIYPADSKGRIRWKEGKRVNVLPIAQSLADSKESSKKADLERNKAVASGGTGTTAGAVENQEVILGSTPEPSVPTVEIPPEIVGFDWVTFGLYFVLAVGIAAAVYFIINWRNARRKQKDSLNKAARQMVQASIRAEAQDASLNWGDSQDGHISSIAAGD